MVTKFNLQHHWPVPLKKEHEGRILIEVSLKCWTESWQHYSQEHDI